MANVIEQIKKTKAAQKNLAVLTAAKRGQILLDLAKLIESNEKHIIAVNAKDLKALKRLEMRDRLVLNAKRVQSIITGLTDVANMADPLNKVLEKKSLKNGLK